MEDTKPTLLWHYEESPYQDGNLDKDLKPRIVSLDNNYGRVTSSDLDCHGDVKPYVSEDGNPDTNSNINDDMTAPFITSDCPDVGANPTNEDMKPSICNICQLCVHNNDMKEHKIKHQKHVANILSTDIETQNNSWTEYVQNSSKALPFACSFCPAKFERPFCLDKHTNRHLFAKEFRCDECQATFAYIDSLHIHKEKHYNQKNFKCYDCGFGSFLEVQFLKHIMNPKDTAYPFQCLLCDHTLSSFCGFKSHVNLKHGSGKITEALGLSFSGLHENVSCSDCTLSFDTKLLQWTHIREKHPNTIETPEHALQSSAENLRNEDEVSKTFLCRLCYANFARFPCMKQHETTCSFKFQVACGHCMAHFFNIDNYNEHRQNHEMFQKHFKCNDCDYGTFNEEEFLKHRYIPRKTSPFVCELCLLSFDCYNQLRYHLLKTHNMHVQSMCNRHPKSKWARKWRYSAQHYKCELCAEVFKKRRNFIKHKRMKHNLIQQNESATREVTKINSIYHCAKCGKKYPNGSESKHVCNQNHVRARNSAKQRFQCNECGKTFRSGHLMQYHSCAGPAMKFQRLFRCLECMKDFKSRQAKNLHKCAKKFNHFFLCIQCNTCVTLNLSKVCVLCEAKKNNQMAPSSSNYTCRECKINLTYNDTKVCHQCMIQSTNVTREPRERTTCTRCEKSFDNKKAMINHLCIVNDTVNRNLICILCQTTFISKYEKLSHLCADMVNDASPVSYEISSTAVNVQEIFECLACKRWFYNAQAKNSHRCYEKIPETKLEQTVKVQIFHCAKCGGDFESKREVQLHVCTDLTSFIKYLDKCDKFKTFVDASLQSYPKKLKTNETLKRQCPHCPKSFANNFILKEHVNKEHLTESGI